MTDRDTTRAKPERRNREAFRRLIDEMMAQLREVSSREMWTDEARAQAEADLERIMTSVRQEALGDDRRE
ncbi:MAG: hypothetical protein ACRENI_04635 [Gemmatimonadaceae bacterium]